MNIGREMARRKNYPSDLHSAVFSNYFFSLEAGTVTLHTAGAREI